MGVGAGKGSLLVSRRYARGTTKSETRGTGNGGANGFRKGLLKGLSPSEAGEAAGVSLSYSCGSRGSRVVIDSVSEVGSGSAVVLDS